MLTRKLSARGALLFALAMTLVLGLGCFPGHAVGLGEGDTGATLGATLRTEDEIDELVRSMTSSGDYVEGEAIVCFLGAETKTTPGVHAQSEDLLATAQTLSSVTARQYVEATGEAIPAAAGQGMLTSQSEESETLPSLYPSFPERRTFSAV